MKFTCDSSLLFKSINIVEKAVAQKTTVSVLENILFDISDVLTLRANNLDIGIEHCMSVDIVDNSFPNAVLIKGKTISNILSKIPQQKLEISIDTNYRIRLVGNGVNYDMLGMTPDDFPNFPEIISGQHLQFNGEELKAMIKSTLFSVSSDETKPFLNGVFLNAEHNVLSFVATDGFRLALRQHTLGLDVEKISLIVPFKAMNELNKILSLFSPDISVNMIASEQQVCFFSENFKLVSRLIKAHFPDYKKVIPQFSQYRVKVSRKEFLEACDRAMIIAEASSFIVRLTFDEDSLVIKANAPLGEFKEKLRVSREKGEDSVTILFNVKVILEGVRVIESDDIELEFNQGTGPCLIMAAGQTDYIYLAMPIKANNYQEDTF